MTKKKPNFKNKIEKIYKSKILNIIFFNKNIEKNYIQKPMNINKKKF